MPAASGARRNSRRAKELQEEFCDAYWCADLLKDEVLKVRIQLWCRDMWQELEGRLEQAL
jgi:hypothetical protein